MGCTSVALNLALALQAPVDSRSPSAGPFTAPTLYFDLGRMHGNAERRLRSIAGQVREPARFLERTHMPPLPLRLWDAWAESAGTLVSHVRCIAADTPISAVFFDWIQLLFGYNRDDWEPVRISRVLVELQHLAAELGVPVVALSNLPRELEERADRRPQLADFAGVGLPSEVAPRFVSLYRDAYYSSEPADVWAEPQSHRRTPWWEPAELCVWEKGAFGSTVHVLPFHPPSGLVRLN